MQLFRLKLPVLLILLLGLCEITSGIGCNRNSSDGKPNAATIAVYMQQRYRRELHADQYSMNYIPKSTSTVLISVTHYPTANRQLISTQIESAKELIRKKGQELFDLSTIEIEVEIKEIERPR